MMSGCLGALTVFLSLLHNALLVSWCRACVVDVSVGLGAVLCILTSCSGVPLLQKAASLMEGESYTYCGYEDKYLEFSIYDTGLGK